MQEHNFTPTAERKWGLKSHTILAAFIDRMCNISLFSSDLSFSLDGLIRTLFHFDVKNTT